MRWLEILCVLACLSGGCLDFPALRSGFEEINPDAGSPPGDLAMDPMDPEDPGRAGPYKVARPQVTLSTAANNAISAVVIFTPSADGTTVDRSKAPYSLVLLTPPRYLQLSSLDAYAERLASHGFVVAMYRSRDEDNQVSYRNAGLVLLNEILNSTDPNLMSLSDSKKIGLVGYELGAKISAAMAVQDSRVGALFMIDPVDVTAATGPLMGIQEVSQVILAGIAPIAFLGGSASATVMPACYLMSQGYKNFYDVVTKPAFNIEFVGGALGDYVSLYPDPPCAAGSSVDKNRTKALTQKYMTAYFQWLLKGRARSRDYLLGTEFQRDKQQGMLALSQKGL